MEGLEGLEGLSQHMHVRACARMCAFNDADPSDPSNAAVFRGFFFPPTLPVPFQMEGSISSGPPKVRRQVTAALSSEPDTPPDAPS